jgi:Zn finger protein HypA/HybF involved in hydrogenase expression
MKEFKMKIIKNAVRCLTCGDTIESKHRHDFVTCSCGRISVDGGHDYLKRSFVPGCEYEDVGEYEEIEGI